ncbi:MAG: hypothetical protein AAF683_10970 [Pseudomonadota bacterium]
MQCTRPISEAEHHARHGMCACNARRISAMVNHLLGASAALALSACSVAGATVGAVGTAAKVTTSAAGVATKTAVGGVKLGARGANAVLTDDPAVPKRTLQANAAEAIGVRRSQVRVSDIYEDLNRTDYTATVDRTPYFCAVVEVDGDVSDAACELALE